MTGFFAEGRYCEPTTSQDAHIRAAATQLTAAGVDDPMGNARKLWAHVFLMDEGSQDKAKKDGYAQQFQELVSRRADRAPMSHLLGYRDFYKHRFLVTPEVLDPRPDTETLIEHALSKPFSTVLDLGTGSGCILLSLLAERDLARGVGVDLSEAAIAVAARNAQHIGVASRATLVLSDWFENVSGQFDLIVSNPPYVALSEMADLAPEVRGHEPREALTDEADGLTFYRSIIQQAARYLMPNGRLLVEIGPTQGAAVSQMMRDAGFASVGIRSDLDGRDRVVFAHNSSKTH